LQNLSHPHNLPNKFKLKIYSSDISQTFVLLNDKHDTNVSAKSLFNTIRSTFQPHSCKLIHINSNPLNKPNLKTIDVWGPYINLNINFPKSKNIKNDLINKKSSNTSNVRGLYLNDEDLSVLQKFINDVVLFVAMPFVEKRIKTLYTIVSQQRKGIANSFKKFFTGKKNKLR